MSAFRTLKTELHNRGVSLTLAADGYRVACPSALGPMVEICDDLSDAADAGRAMAHSRVTEALAAAGYVPQPQHRAAAPAIAFRGL